MSASSKLSCIPILLRVKCVLILLTPIAAWAVEQTIRRRAGGVEDVSLWTWGAVIVFSMVGWIVSDLDKVAELWKPGESAYEQWRERLKLFKGITASCAAGVATYFIGEWMPGWILGAMQLKTQDGTPIVIPEVILLLFVGGAGYMGTRWFAALERKWTGSSA